MGANVLLLNLCPAPMHDPKGLSCKQCLRRFVRRKGDTCNNSYFVSSPAFLHTAAPDIKSPYRTTKSLSKQLYKASALNFPLALGTRHPKNASPGPVSGGYATYMVCFSPLYASMVHSGSELPVYGWWWGCCCTGRPDAPGSLVAIEALCSIRDHV
jgi:hypothetical protein